ncbi:MAG: signal peptidase I [Parvibaculaceae bacterium]|nr:signal peptidase I [Parvibaculaceae bacterium]
MVDKTDTARSSTTGENVRTIAYALLVALIIRAFLFQPFNIPTESMLPTLLVGDYLFVEKYAYGYSRHSFPFSPPIFSGRIFGSDPERGDVVVFKTPSDNRTDFIKRLIGLPGDTIQVTHGVLILNGKPVPKVRVQDFVDIDPFGNERRVPQYRETLPDGKSYLTLDLLDDGPEDNTDVYRVPPGHYFMMGDNRDNSTDSRVLSEVGYVPAENLVGKAEVIFFSANGEAHWWEIWKWPQGIRWGRILRWVQ